MLHRPLPQCPPTLRPLRQVYERTVFTSINRWLTNQLRFMPGGDGSSCASSSYDGSIKVRRALRGASAAGHACRDGIAKIMVGRTDGCACGAGHARRGQPRTTCALCLPAADI